MKCINCGAENPEDSEMCCECGDDFNIQLAPLPEGMDDELYFLIKEAKLAHKSLQKFPRFYDFLYDFQEVLSDTRAQRSLGELISECIEDQQYCSPKLEYALDFDKETLELAITLVGVKVPKNDVVKQFCCWC